VSGYLRGVQMAAYAEAVRMELAAGQKPLAVAAELREAANDRTAHLDECQRSYLRSAALMLEQMYLAEDRR
jgi:hypothetical protein